METELLDVLRSAVSSAGLQRIHPLPRNHDKDVIRNLCKLARL